MKSSQELKVDLLSSSPADALDSTKHPPRSLILASR